MRRSLAALWHGLWLNRQQQSLLTVTLSLATSLWLWLEGGRVLDVESLQNLWRSTHHPQPLFEHLLAPLAGNPDLAVAIMALLSTLSLWLYCRLSRLIGIGPQTTFILFLLLNFNPEYNDVRLQISRFQPVLLLWLAGLYLFLAHYKNHIHLAFLSWATTAWLGALFVPIAAFWAGGFPLLFLLWPGRGNWRRRLCERGRFLLAYYALIALIIALVPAWRHAIGDWLPELIAQIDLKRSEIAFLINADNPVDLTITEGYLVALVLVALNAIKIMGPVITILALLALSRRVLNTVLEKRVRHFHTCSLIWIWGMAAVAYLYYGYLPSDLYYTPVTMLALWLASGVVFYALQRIKSGRIPPERLLILLWLIIAYALASIITIGPRLTYLREAGEWARAHQPANGATYSNNLTALAYSGRPPYLDGQAYIDMEHPRQEYFELTPDDLLAHIKGRKQAEPQDLDLFDILAEYHNDRGDKAYILRVKTE